ncbi:phosphoadenylyl-sulfate reductase [Aestuariivirga litoralis]|uniref:phosphoadenylyl-sulfate reductase n=1 Tax=Aestuariivirga litoralis TaxID=2650924 RepID=UPI0018C50D0A|nr:phosphoadenylyl-sulfate reductase [Aestuariivirga litoralis]MBG1231591.1 phosphoadenylyl-sulfate reductase [Aestuariivirga litoralis]
MLARNPQPQPINQNEVLEAYAGLEGRDLIRAFARDFEGRIALLSSFGAESSVLLHMLSEVDPSIPVIFLDTLKLFPETIAYRDRLTRELGLRDVRVFQPNVADLERDDPAGTLHLSSPDRCCHIRKTLPMEKAFRGFDVMISGRKRFHGAARSDLKPISFDDQRIKLEPLASFTSLDLHNYKVMRQLPSHPLNLEGYHSIGCAPTTCTTKGGSADNPRAGRWMGQEKTECGIHFSANGKIIRMEARGSAADLVNA